MKTLLIVVLASLTFNVQADGICAFGGEAKLLLRGLTVKVVDGDTYLCNGVKWCHKLDRVIDPVTGLPE